MVTLLSGWQAVVPLWYLESSLASVLQPKLVSVAIMTRLSHMSAFEMKTINMERSFCSAVKMIWRTAVIGQSLFKRAGFYLGSLLEASCVCNYMWAVDFWTWRFHVLLCVLQHRGKRIPPLLGMAASACLKIIIVCLRGWSVGTTPSPQSGALRSLRPAWIHVTFTVFDHRKHSAEHHPSYELLSVSLTDVCSRRS